MLGLSEIDTTDHTINADVSAQSSDEHWNIDTQSIIPASDHTFALEPSQERDAHWNVEIQSTTPANDHTLEAEASAQDYGEH